MNVLTEIFDISISVLAKVLIIVLDKELELEEIIDLSDFDSENSLSLGLVLSLVVETITFT